MLAGDRISRRRSYRRIASCNLLVQLAPACYAGWQRDLIVSLVKLSEATGDRAYARKALDIAVGMQQRGVVAPRDAWIVAELKRRGGPG
jgi:hypothetical protein